MNQKLESRPYTAWQLIRVYWQSEYRFSAYVLLISVLVMSVMLVGLDVALTDWYNYFYTSLQEYNKRAVLDLLWIFILIATTSIVISVYRFYLQQILGLRWRRWLTQQFISRWLQKRGYYYLENFEKTTDNPDQRIQEDIASLVSYTLDLVLGLLSSVVSIFSFIYILWKLSGTLTIPLGSYGVWHVHGYLVWVSIIYATIGSYLTYKIGRPLVPLNFEQQRREANFRYAAVDLRTHSEDIALYRGEDYQKTELNGSLKRVLNNWYMIILRQKLLLWFTSGYNQISVLVPLAVALPNYFNKVFELGGLIQSLAAFDRIQSALSYFVNAYTRIAEWQAISARLVTFLNHIDEVEHAAEQEDHFVIQNIPQNKIVTKNLVIKTPDGETLMKNIDQEFVHGQSYWLKGNSGIGKSTFVRAVAGIWPYGAGEIDLPDKKNMMFIPQKFYMPIGTLREALIFPNHVFHLSDNDLMKLLMDCDLPELTKQLHQVSKWSEALSPGELQRIAFVRVFVHQPDWVFLDECTSALDLDHEKQLYELLKKQLPNCSFISVGHRPTLAPYHDHQIDMTQFSVARSGNGRKEVETEL